MKTCPICAKEFHARKPEQTYCSHPCRDVAFVKSRLGRRRIPVEDRFWSKVNILGLDDCWEWQAARLTSGDYGVFSYEGKPQRANRLAYIFKKGPIPEGQFVCHTCDNPPCVNPAHLFLGNNKENMEDCKSKGRSNSPLRIARMPRGDKHYSKTQPDKVLRGEKNGGSKLTWVEVNCIRDLYLTGNYSYGQLADMFHIHNSVIGKIIRNISWKL